MVAIPPSVITNPAMRFAACTLRLVFRRRTRPENVPGASELVSFAIRTT
jgi:hypothetical protein